MSLIKDSFVILLIRIAGLVMQLLTFALVTRTHTLYEVGIFAFINALWIITRTLGALGYDQAALRFIPSYLSQKKHDWVLEFLQRAIEQIKATLLYVCIILIVIASIILYFDGGYFSYGWAILLLALGIYAYALMGLNVCVIRALNKSIQAQLPESILLQILFVFGVGFTVYFDVACVEYTLAIQMSAAWCVLGVYQFIVAKTVNHQIIDNDLKLDFDTVQSMASTTFKAMTATALAARMPVILLALVVSADAVGLFEGAFRLGLLGTIPVWAVGVVVSPMISRAVADNDSSLLKHLYAVASIIQTIPALLIFLFLLITGEVVLGVLFGTPFEAAYMAMVIIAFATLINAMGAIASNYLLMTGGEKIVQTYSVWSLVVVLIGIPVGALTHGFEGSAFALVIRSLVRDLGLMIVVIKTKGLKPGFFSLIELKWMYGRITSYKWFKVSKKKQY